MPVRLELRIQGIGGIRQALDSDELYREPVKDLLDEMGKKGVEVAKANAPVDTGYLRDHITYRSMASFGGPLAVEIQSTAKNNGFNYGWFLNFAPKWHHVGWFTVPLANLAKVAEPLFRATMSRIEREWTKRNAQYR